MLKVTNRIGEGYFVSTTDHEALERWSTFIIHDYKENVMKFSFLKKKNKNRIFLTTKLCLYYEWMHVSITPMVADGFTRLSFQQVVQRLPVTISYNLLD